MLSATNLHSTLRVKILLLLYKEIKFDALLGKNFRRGHFEIFSSEKWH